MQMTDIVNLILNSGVAVVVVGYFIYKDNKWNNELVKTLTEITVTMKSMQSKLDKMGDDEDD